MSTSLALPHPNPRPRPATKPSTWPLYLPYPTILGAVVAVAAWAIATEQDLPLVGMLTTFGTIAALVACELVLPFDRAWRADAREWLRDGVYFGLNGLVDGLTKSAISAAAIVVAPYLDWGAATLPLIVAVPLAVAIADLAGYWMHRLSHDVPWLWKVHGVHHAPTKVNAFNNNTAHFLNIVFSSTAKTLPLLALGFGPEAIFVATLFLTAQSFAVHVNADLRLGVLNWVIMGPEHHRLHHSTDLAEAGNHAIGLTLWDIAFGTFTWRPGRRPTAVGTVNPDEFPAPNHIVANALVPFNRAPAAVLVLALAAGGCAAHRADPESAADRPVPEHHGAVLAEATAEAAAFHDTLRRPRIAGAMARAVSAALRGDCPIAAALSDPNGIADRLASGAAPEDIWAALDPFTGRWRGRWRDMEVAHEWYPARRGDLPTLAGGAVVASQYAWVGDGYGWNVELRDGAGAHHLLGSVVHLDHAGGRTRVPHVGIPGPAGHIAWIVPGRLYLERAYEDGDRYLIREYRWSLDGDQVALTAEYATEYRRPQAASVR